MSLPFSAEMLLAFTSLPSFSFQTTASAAFVVVLMKSLYFTVLDSVKYWLFVVPGLSLGEYRRQVSEQAKCRLFCLLYLVPAVDYERNRLKMVHLLIIT